MTLLAARSRIRPYILADRQSLIATINSVCAEGCWMRTLRYEPTPAWEHALAQPDCSCHLLLVVIDGEHVVGWSRVFRDQSTNTRADVAVGLLVDYRKRKIGTDLLKEAIEWSENHNITRLHLSTRVSNTHAIHLFQQFKFATTIIHGDGWMEMERTLK